VKVDTPQAESAVAADLLRNVLFFLVSPPYQVGRAAHSLEHGSKERAS
jgi:hypothetical protein